MRERERERKIEEEKKREQGNHDARILLFS